MSDGWEARVAGIDALRDSLGADFGRTGSAIEIWLRGWAQRLEDEFRYPNGQADHETGYTVQEIERTADLLASALAEACRHRRLVDINTFDDMIRLQGKARVHLCNDCSETLEVPT